MFQMRFGTIGRAPGNERGLLMRVTYRPSKAAT